MGGRVIKCPYPLNVIKDTYSCTTIAVIGHVQMNISTQYIYRPSEKDAKLAQKLGQLQSFIAVFPQECNGQLASLGQPNTFLAKAKAYAARGYRAGRQRRTPGPSARTGEQHIHGAQGAHLNPLGLFLRASIPFI